jgi:N-acetylneuraminate synthase
MPNRCIVIGEVAQAHDGSLGMAHAFIDAIADAGADAVKFQTHIAAAESTPAEPWRIKFSRQDASRYDYWRRMEFSEAQWHELKAHAAQRGLIFLSSPFSIEAVDLLTRVGVAAWKIASGEITNAPMLDRIAATRLPVLLSTGVSPLAEIDGVVQRFASSGIPLTVLQCTTAYPCAPERVGLNLIEFFRARYGCAVGLSDHSGTIYAGLAAAAIGIDALEVHVTFSRAMFGVDVPASVTVDELRQLVDGVRFIERMKANPVQKDDVANEMREVRGLFTKSLVFARDLRAGSVLQKDDFKLKKPGTGIAVTELSAFIGRRLIRNVNADELLKDTDVVPM